MIKFCNVRFKFCTYILFIILSVIYSTPQSFADDGFQRDLLIIKQKAEKGDKRAQQFIAMAYKNGYFGPENKAKSLEYYTKAANQGDIESQYNLGVMYANGYYTSVDAIEAEKWLIKAAHQGDKRAQIFLASMYKNGVKGIPKDKAKADKYAKKACEDINYSSSAVLHPDSLTGQCLMYNDYKGLEK
ncbi:tetratricopeptide repeat protein [Commensalibacter papalotli (ex Servin-Garciduenas et al. 2014)]|uniref:Sel1 repeat family protein n=1 Tax=Commensalibacter papalotli (ex Servin-Garciduenas et al. 2014) TaxID=1208583 RepID=W7DXY3_9PROT|nr:tetratricopeptide repeat protein [Commensalibacter papalotli (ex Servin-Garciduenas et al. 2014)]EUK17469.1 hypothetical protein COMX_10023 [Commensalibacter papalotli (ex Servin-Garciduenas et al. 2014)]